MEIDSQRKIKPYDELTFCDSFMFYMVMQDKEICKGVIERLLGIKIRKLDYVNSEQTIMIDYEAKSIRLDVYAEDKNRVFDVEVQTYDEADIGKRLRYYQGVLDIDHLKKGDDYSKLKESIIIFIGTKDVIGKNLPRYTFSNICHEDTKINLDDKAIKVVYNLGADRGSLSESERELLDFMATGNAESNFTKKIEDMVRKLKKNEPWRKQYMTFEVFMNHMSKDLKAEARAEGLAEGRAEGRVVGAHEKAIEAAEKLLKMNVLSLEEIAQVEGLSIEEVSSLAEKVN
ncbi:MAG: Rpn family recombination-promoting nuclease/putative transposase [Treponemataceae bacterium]|nr:Rpn family recombination-promoting nuclease/putative transposase [Treponemataceae bacterium]